MNSPPATPPPARRAKPVLRPLLGFGPWGYALSLIAAALIASLVTGCDLRFYILELVNWCFGWKGLSWFVSWYLTAQNLSLTDPQFGPLGLMTLLVAMHLAPVRQAWWRWWLATAWGLTCPLLWWCTMLLIAKSVGPFAAPWFPAITGGARGSEAAVVVTVPTVLLLYVLTRSWVVAATFIATSLLWLWNSKLILSMSSWVLLDPVYFAILFHIINAAALLTIAIIRRQRAIPPGGCQSCGYDMTGLSPTSQCPECGHSPP